MRIKTGLALTVLCILVGAGHAQTQLTQRGYQTSLRVALTEADFAEAINAASPPDLDRTLTSSQFSTTTSDFVAAYYFVDELSGDRLGSLHVSRFDKRTGRWIHSLNFEDEDATGAVQHVEIAEPYIFVGLHWNPSAGATVLLEHATLRFVKAVAGTVFYANAGGRILFEPNEVHFAPTHQASLKELELRSGREVEIFPGARQSTVARNYRQGVRDAYARLTENQKDEFRHDNYGPVDDFDRQITALRNTMDGDRLAFVVRYDSSRLERLPQHPGPRYSLAQCARRTDGSWSCVESDLRTASSELGVAVTPNQANDWIDDDAAERLLEAALARRLAR